MLISSAPISSIPISSRSAGIVVVAETPEICPYIPGRPDESAGFVGQVGGASSYFLATAGQDHLVGRPDFGFDSALVANSSDATTGRESEGVDVFLKVDGDFAHVAVSVRRDEFFLTSGQADVLVARSDNSVDLSARRAENDGASGRADECR